MDIEFEKKIARAFVYRNKRDRFIFDLSRKSKGFFGELSRDRFNAICRLETIIDDSFSILQSMRFPAPIEIERIMTSYGVKDMCYVLSENRDFDGVYIELTTAIYKLQCNGFPSLIVGLPSGFSHFKGDSYASTQPNCFLKPSVRFDGIPWNN